MNALFSGIGNDRVGHKIIHTFNEKNLYHVVDSTRLLSSVYRRKAMDEIKDAAAVPNEYYDSLYKELLHNFVAFVQILPVNNEAKLSSLLDEGLMRGLFALQIQQKASKGEADPMMSYVIFSTALLFDIGCVIENRTVIISEEDGSFIKIWDPYHDGSMSIGSYYRIRRGGGLMPWSSRRSAIALACKLLPPSGFDWIYKNPHAFNIWLALLADDKEGAGTLRMHFERARERLEVFKTSADFFVPQDIEEIEAKATQNAEDFLDWLKEALANGKIAANVVNGQIFDIEGDKLFFTNELFKRYAESKNNKVDWKDVLDEFEKLGFTNGKEVDYFYARQRAAVESGVKIPGASRQSLFGGGVRAAEHMENVNIGQGEHKAADVVNVVSEKTPSGIMTAEKITSAGGRLEGVIVADITQGLVLPTANYPVIVVPSVPQQAIANQFPSVEQQQQQQQQQAQNIVNSASAVPRPSF